MLSDNLDDDSVQTLVRIALGDLFPELCIEWRALKLDISDIFLQERTRRKSVVAQDVINTESSLRRALREEVVDHVISLFPYYLLFHLVDLAYGAYLVLQVFGSRWPLLQYTTTRQRRTGG